MRLDRESRRTLVQFLNGIAVAVIGIGAITPTLAGNPSWTVLLAIITGACLCAVALWAARGRGG